MRRTLVVLSTLFAFIVASAEIAQAAPIEPSSPVTETLTKTVRLKGPGRAEFRLNDKNTLQPPPGGGCDWSDIQAEATGYYTNGVFSSITGSWHARIMCFTTAPGQSLGGITVNSQLWHNGNQKATGVPFSCVNCNLGNSPGSWTDGPGGYGTYWVGATFFLKLPAGYIWTGWPTSCNPTVDRTALTCVGTSGTMYLPPTN